MAIMIAFGHEQISRGVPSAAKGGDVGPISPRDTPLIYIIMERQLHIDMHEVDAFAGISSKPSEQAQLMSR